jgi:hypothetical protein
VTQLREISYGSELQNTAIQITRNNYVTFSLLGSQSFSALCPNRTDANNFSSASVHPLRPQYLTRQDVASLEGYGTFHVVRAIEVQRPFESNLKSRGSDKLRRRNLGLIVVGEFLDLRKSIRVGAENFPANNFMSYLYHLL